MFFVSPKHNTSVIKVSKKRKRGPQTHTKEKPSTQEQNVTGEKHSIQEDQSTEKPNTNLKHKQRRQKTVSNEKENNEANSTKDSVVRDNRQYVLAGTGLQKGSADRMIRLASSLGGIVKTKLSTRVTHLITDCFKEGHAQRTMKYFHAILSGIWILDFAWIK